VQAEEIADALEPAPEASGRKYSPSVRTGARKRWVEGDPDPAKISTSHDEGHNPAMGMSIRRFSRLTNALSKKIEDHCHALALHFVWSNFRRQHKAH
jgi:hypothetical protein